MRGPRRAGRIWPAIACVAVAAIVGLVGAPLLDGPTAATRAGAAVTGIHKIKHVIIIMQENRSFDDYFGTYPGATGIPMKHGEPTVCNRNPKNGQCVKAYPVHTDVEDDLPHNALASVRGVNNGKMNGFVSAANRGSFGILGKGAMAYHTAGDIPNYWAYARSNVLQDHMFAPARSWSLPEHLFMVSAWSAKCPSHTSMACFGDINGPAPAPPEFGDPLHVKINANTPIYAWTDLTYLMFKHKVSWGYYVVAGAEPDCSTGAQISCAPRPLKYTTPGFWNPLPYFDTVRKDKQLRNIKSVDRFYAEAAKGTLPAVSWVTPSQDVSEHPPAAISAGQSYVTSLINAVMRGPDWKSTAIFVSWDDWGGFYDNVKPPKIDNNGYGIRVPGLVVSPYARKGYVDHQTLSSDSYLKFIEDDFMSSRRIDPKTDGRPDRRPDVRENAKQLGDLVNDFDFSQKPRAPKLLPLHPKTTLIAQVPFAPLVKSATPDVGKVTLVWDVPSSDGGRAIDHYLVTPYRNGVAEPAHTYPVNAPYVYTDVIAGLVSGAQYSFTVQAVNALGPGAAGQSPTVTVR